MKKLKLVLLGSSEVGKTAIIDQFTQKNIQDIYYLTISIDKYTKEITLINGKKLQLEIWDTPGHECYKPHSKIYLKNTNIVLLIYDITDKRSFEKLNYFYNDFCDVNKKENIFFGVVGNKNDLYGEQVISSEEGEEYANTINALFFAQAIL